ncbi:MAG: TRAP transporter large permease subunit [Steroidobacteraceae bacterium]
MEFAALALFVGIVLALLAGYPVAFTLGGVSLLFALLGSAFGWFDLNYLQAFPSRIFGTMSNETLIAVPLFIFMGLTLERANIAEELLGALAQLFGRVRGGLAYAVLVVGTLLAASTGIVGATVVTMGLLCLPAMLRRRYDARLSSGIIAASGTLGQIIPPSIVLVLLGDVLSSAFAQSQLKRGIYSPETVSVGDLFAGALLPGLLLVGLYLLYLFFISRVRPAWMPLGETPRASESGVGLATRLGAALFAPLLLILAVLGSIIAGIATPSEAAAVGAVGALLLAGLRRALTLARLADIMRGTVRMSSMVFMILIGASLFSLVFRGLGGDEVVHEALASLPGGALGAMLIVMLALFLLGFVLDFIEITYVVVPIVGPPLMALGLDPIWLGVMIAMNLQTSFLTPPFGFALFYLRGVAPPEVETRTIYAGAIPFIILQLLALLAVACWPQLALWLPQTFYGN